MGHVQMQVIKGGREKGSPVGTGASGRGRTSVCRDWGHGRIEEDSVVVILAVDWE